MYTHTRTYTQQRDEEKKNPVHLKASVSTVVVLFFISNHFPFYHWIQYRLSKSIAKLKISNHEIWIDL